MLLNSSVYTVVDEFVQYFVSLRIIFVLYFSFILSCSFYIGIYITDDKAYKVVF